MSDDDPFEQFDDDREGDPFDQLRDEAEERSRTTDDPASEATDDPASNTVDGPATDTPDAEDDTGTDTAARSDPVSSVQHDTVSRFDDAEPAGDFGTESDPETTVSATRDDATGASEGEAGDDASPGTDFDDESFDGEAVDPGQFIDTDHEGDPFGASDSVFQQQDIDGIDADEVWDRISEARQHRVESEPEAVEEVVNKHQFCEGCEYFSPPPNVHCTHEGTTILEFTDMDHVTVHNCPIVAQRRELEQMGE